MRTYKHLTMTDRLRIEKWLKMGMKPREVADKLRVHVSTIYRELKRGAYDRLDDGTWEVKTAYSPDIAEEKYQAHLREKGPDLKIGNDHELANYIETTILDKDCSPAAVLGFAMIEGKKFKTSLSVPTIYKYISDFLCTTSLFGSNMAECTSSWASSACHAYGKIILRIDGIIRKASFDIRREVEVFALVEVLFPIRA